MCETPRHDEQLVEQEAEEGRDHVKSNPHA